jgi:hypothetical protein
MVAGWMERQREEDTDDEDGISLFFSFLFSCLVHISKEMTELSDKFWESMTCQTIDAGLESYAYAYFKWMDWIGGDVMCNALCLA